MPTATLTRADWVAAAAAALLADGPDAVAVQPLSRALGTTKGSFYWHFGGRDELLAAALERWTTLHTDDVIARIDDMTGTPIEKLGALFGSVTEDALRHRGELRLLAGAEHPLVADALARATSRRIDYVAGLLRAQGLPRGAARRRAELAYAAYLGFAQLAAAVPGAIPPTRRSRARLRDELMRILSAE